MSRGFGIYHMQFNQFDHFWVVFKEVAVIFSFALVSIDTIEFTASLWSTLVYCAFIIVTEIYTLTIFVWQTPF